MDHMKEIIEIIENMQLAELNEELELMKQYETPESKLGMNLILAELEKRNRS